MSFTSIIRDSAVPPLLYWPTNKTPIVSYSKITESAILVHETSILDKPTEIRV